MILCPMHLEVVGQGEQKYHLDIDDNQFCFSLTSESGVEPMPGFKNELDVGQLIQDEFQ